MDKELLKFISNAHRHTYAAPAEIRQKHRCEKSIRLGHKDYFFKEGDFSYQDSYAGSKMAPGREVVFYKDKPIWSMAYQGKSSDDLDEEFFQNIAFPFLKKALMNFKDEMPYRGPSEYIEGDFKYTFEMNGNLEYFTGQEKIFYKEKVIFLQDIMGSKIK